MSRLVLGLILWALCAASVSAQGTLQRLREETAPKPSDNHSSDSSSSSSSCFDSPSDDSDGGWGTLFAPLFIEGCKIAAIPLWGPAVLLDDTIWNPGYFPLHPYAGNWNGYVQIERKEGELKHRLETVFGDPDYLKWWSVRFSVEDGNDFRGLNRLNGHLFLDTTLRIGLWTNWNYLHERLDCGCSDDALLSDTNLTFRIAQSESIVMHAGVGFRMLNDRFVDRYGFNVLYSADVFPVKPLVLSGLLEGGTLGSAGVFHGRGTIGVLHHHFELFTGYDFLRIGSVNIQGPLAGLRFWF